MIYLLPAVADAFTFFCLAVDCALSCARKEKPQEQLKKKDKGMDLLYASTLQAVARVSMFPETRGSSDELRPWLGWDQLCILNEMHHDKCCFRVRCR